MPLFRSAGMADRVLGTVGAFFYALLTRRAFQLEAWGDLPGFEVCDALVGAPYGSDPAWSPGGRWPGLFVTRSVILPRMQHSRQW